MKLTSLSVFLLSCSLPCLAQTPLITGINTTAPLRNNYSGFVGTQFPTDYAGLIVSSLGRACVAGNSGTHTVKLTDGLGGSDVAGGSVSINMSGCTPGTFRYAALPVPVPLTANYVFYLVSQETAGGDQWYDLSYVNDTLLAPLDGAVYSEPGGRFVVVGGTTGYSYVPVNLLYTSGTPGPLTVTVSAPTSGQVLSGPGNFVFTAGITPPNAPYAQNFTFQVDGQPIEPTPQFPTGGNTNPELYTYTFDPTLLLSGPHTVTGIYYPTATTTTTSAPVPFSVSGGASPLVTSDTLGTLRNNFTGWVGMEFTTPGIAGSPGSPGSGDILQVTSLARYVVAGNQQPHILKLVDAVTGSDLAGVAATVNTISATPGTFAYAYLFPPVTLQVAHPYYLLSLETAGGDQWADLGPVNTSNILVNGPVYQPTGPGANPLSAYVLVPLQGSSYVPLSLGFKDLGTDPGPSVAITSPTANATLPNAVFNVQATVTPGSSLETIVSVQLVVDGVPGTPQTTGLTNPISLPLDPTSLFNGTHNLVVQATDSAGVSASSPSVAVQVNHSATSTPMLLSFTPTFLRNNFAGLVGMQFQVGATPVSVSALGRYCVAGNNQSHQTSLYVVGAPGTPPVAQTFVTMTGCTAGQYQYSNLLQPALLSAGSSYYLVDQEYAGGDQWYDYATVTAGSAFKVIGAAYSAPYFTTLSFPSTSYVPLNLLYTTPAVSAGNLLVSAPNVQGQPPAPVTVTVAATDTAPITSVQVKVDGYALSPPLTTAPYTQSLPSINFGQHTFSATATDSLGAVANASITELLNPQLGFGYTSLVSIYNYVGNLRNNYTGWVGFQFTTGTTYTLPGTNNTVNVLVPNIVGRVCQAGNALPHIVKLVQASDGTDVPGGSSWINCGSAGPYYGSISATLLPNTKYYVVSQEVTGGDLFTDISQAIPVTGSVGGAGNVPEYSSFTIDGPVYFDGLKYVLVPIPNYSYASVSIGTFTSGI